MMAHTDTPNPPSVGEMVRLIRRDRAKRLPLTDMTSAELLALASTSEDSETRLLAAVLSAMSSGQRCLLRFKSR